MDLSFYQQTIEQCFPNLAISDIRFLGGGTCRVFQVNVEWVFRFPHGKEGSALIRREHQLYERLGSLLSLPVPRYIYFSKQGCAMFPWPVAGYRRLDGVSLESLDIAPHQAWPLVPQIAGFLSEFHCLGRAQLAGLDLPSFDYARWLAGQRRFYHTIHQRAWPLLNSAEKKWTDHLFESALAGPNLWTSAPTLVHGDFDASNILCDTTGETLTGVIDFEEAGWGDPAWDFCALRVEFGRVFLDRLLAAYTGPVDEPLLARIEFNARRILFIELLYGIETGEAAHVEHGLARLRRAVADQDVIGGWLPRSTSATRQTDGFPD